MLVLMLASGVAAVATSDSAGAFFVLAGLCLVPAIAVAASSRSLLLVGFLIFTPALDAFSVATPIATASIGTISVFVWLAFFGRESASAAINRIPSKVLLALAGFVGSQAFQVLHIGPLGATREAVTLGGFAVYWLVGVWAAEQPSRVAALAWAAFLGLLFLGATGLAGAYDILPRLGSQFSAAGASRAIFGFESPFPRNFGVGVSNSTPAAMMALALPWMLVRVRVAGGANRVALLFGISLVGVIAVLLFQSRSMILEFILALGFVPVFARRRGSVGLIRVVAVVGGIVLFGYVAWSLTENAGRESMVSSDLRSSSYGEAVTFFRSHPAALLVGTDQDAFRVAVNEASPFAAQIPADAPVHNFLIESIARGGLVAGAGLLIVIGVPALTLGRRMMSRPDDLSTVLLCSLLMLSIELMITPPVAKAGGIWIVLGVAAAAATTSKRRLLPGERSAAVSPVQHLTKDGPAADVEGGR